MNQSRPGRIYPVKVCHVPASADSRLKPVLAKELTECVFLSMLFLLFSPPLF
jgi:hypothetical protein